jgi:hypothetical protein
MRSSSANSLSPERITTGRGEGISGRPWAQDEAKSAAQASTNKDPEGPENLL